MRTTILSILGLGFSLFLILFSLQASEVTFQSLDELLDQRLINKDTLIMLAQVTKYAREYTDTAVISTYNVKVIRFFAR